MNTNDLVKRLRTIGPPLRAPEAELAQAVLEYVLVLALFAVTAIGAITALGCDISVSSNAIATNVFSAG